MNSCSISPPSIATGFVQFLQEAQDVKARARSLYETCGAKEGDETMAGPAEMDIAALQVRLCASVFG